MKYLIGKPMLFATMLFLLGCLETAFTQQLGPAYLKMSLNGSGALNLSIEDGMHNYTPIVAYVTARAVVGRNGDTIQAHTLFIQASAMIDQVYGKSKSLSIILQNVSEPGVYRLLEHGAIVVYSDASRGGTSDLGEIMGWHAGVDEENTSGTVTITEIGESVVRGLGWPVKGSFKIDALGWKIMDSGIKDEDKIAGFLAGSFNWGLPE